MPLDPHNIPNGNFIAAFYENDFTSVKPFAFLDNASVAISYGEPDTIQGVRGGRVHELGGIILGETVRISGSMRELGDPAILRAFLAHGGDVTVQGNPTYAYWRRTIRLGSSADDLPRIILPEHNRAIIDTPLPTPTIAAVLAAVVGGGLTVDTAIVFSVRPCALFLGQDITNGAVGERGGVSSSAAIDTSTGAPANPSATVTLTIPASGLLPNGRLEIWRHLAGQTITNSRAVGWISSDLSRSSANITSVTRASETTITFTILTDVNLATFPVYAAEATSHVRLTTLNEVTTYTRTGATPDYNLGTNYELQRNTAGVIKAGTEYMAHYVYAREPHLKIPIGNGSATDRYYGLCLFQPGYSIDNRLTGHFYYFPKVLPYSDFMHDSGGPGFVGPMGVSVAVYDSDIGDVNSSGLGFVMVHSPVIDYDWATQGINAHTYDTSAAGFNASYAPGSI